MGQLQNQFQQMMGQSPYSGGGQQQNRRVPWRPQTQQGSYSGQPQGGQPISPQRGDQPRVNNPWSEFEPQKPQQPPMQRGIDQMPGRGVQTGGFKPEKGQPQLSGPPMMPPTYNPPMGPPPGTGGIKPSREPVPLGPPAQAPVDGAPISPVQAQASAAGQMQGGSLGQPLGQTPPNPQQAARRRGYSNPYKKQGGPQPDGGPEFMY